MTSLKSAKYVILTRGGFNTFGVDKRVWQALRTIYVYTFDNGLKYEASISKIEHFGTLRF